MFELFISPLHKGCSNWNFSWISVFYFLLTFFKSEFIDKVYHLCNTRTEHWLSTRECNTIIHFECLKFTEVHSAIWYPFIIDMLKHPYKIRFEYRYNLVLNIYELVHEKRRKKIKMRETIIKLFTQRYDVSVHYPTYYTIINILTLQYIRYRNAICVLLMLSLINNIYISNHKVLLVLY